MKRIITTLQQANSEVLKEIEILYPKGIDEDDLTSFTSVNGISFKALEILINDTLYLIRLNNLSYFNNYFEKNEEDYDQDDDRPEDSEFEEENIETDPVED